MCEPHANNYGTKCEPNFFGCDQTYMWQDDLSNCKELLSERWTSKPESECLFIFLGVVPYCD